MTFNSMNIEEFHDVWVFAEQRGGELMPAVFELISDQIPYLIWRSIAFKL